MIEIWTSNKVKLDYNSISRFMNKMIRRLVMGHLRYGAPQTSKKYLTRIELELKAYKRTGNAEHLINIANYCWLEDECPQNSKYHYNTNVDSVTRGRGPE